MSHTKRQLAKLKQERTPGSYTAWPHACARSEHYWSLTVYAKALLLDFLSQYNGRNNGDLCCAFTLMKDRGWCSRTTVEKARAELEQRGWIVRTKQGNRNKPNLYGLTIFKIDEITKLDVRGTGKPLGFWQHGCNQWLLENKLPRPKGRIFSSASSCAIVATTCPRGGQHESLN